jgi:poly(3-hydroxybutyrate) depolymerase
MKFWYALLIAMGVNAMQPQAIAESIEPIDDLQWLFIEDTVALISPPTESIETRARELMEQAASARAAGSLSDMRRSLAEARVLLAKEEWSAAKAFVASLSIRSHESVIDPSATTTIEVGQFFRAKPPSLDPIALRVGLRPWRARPPFSQDVVWLERVETRATDFLENPVVVSVSMSGFDDGAYDLIVQAAQRDEILGLSARRVFIVNHLHRDLQAIDNGVASLTAPLNDSMKASILYPVDLVKGLNQRSRQVRTVQLRAALDRSLGLLQAAKLGNDPLTRSAGNSERHYWLAEAERYEPYRFIVPPSWDGKAELPLVVILHGSNGDHDSVLTNRGLIDEAASRGWAILSPMGYSPNSGWGNHLPVVLANATMPRPRPSTIGGVVLPQDGVDPEPAERDVRRTIELVRAEYPIDGRRIYLIGNSMGGEGTWHLAARFPDLWAAVAPAAGAIAPDRFPYKALGVLPVLAIHGVRDPIVSYEASQQMVRRLKKAGGNGRLLSIIDAGHDAVYKVLPEVFDFFAEHARRDTRRDNGSATAP